MHLFRQIVLLLLFYISVGGAQEITLNEIFHLIKKNHPFIQQQQLMTEIEKSRRNVALTAKNWRIQSAPSYYFSQPVDPSSFTPGEIQQVSLSGGIDKLFWSTGGRFSAQWTSNLTDQDLPSISFPSLPGQFSSFSIGLNRFYKNRFYLNYSQPLLQNYKGTLDRLQYELGKYAVHIADYQSIENQEKFLLGIGQKFISWVLLREKVNITKERLELARKELQHVKEKQKAYLLEEADVLRAEDAVRMAEQNLMLVKSELRAVTSELAITVQSQLITRAKPKFDLYDSITLPDLSQAFIEAKQASRNIKTLKRQQLRLKQLQKSYLEKQKARLNLNLGAGIVGGNRYIEDSFDMHNPDLRISLKFSYPFGRKAGDIQEQKAQLQINQIAHQLASARLDLKSQLSNILIQIGELKNILDLNNKVIESAKMRMEEEQKLYEQGRGQLNFVIASRDNLQNAKLMRAENAARYHAFILQYYELSDKLYDYHPYSKKKEKQ
jgi:outer membrane protein TolC